MYSDNRWGAKYILNGMMDVEYSFEATRAKLSKLKAGALFMRCGTQKIKLAMDLVKDKQDEFDVVVWIAPSSFLGWDTYTKIVDENLAGLYKEICFFSIENISCSDVHYLQLYSLAERSRVFCVVDESITIKNSEAGRTKRLLSLRNMFVYRLILSSLPLTQGLVDLYSQIEFMHPSILNMSETQFVNKYLSPYDDGTLRKWSKPENEKILIEQMRPFIFKCDLKEKYNLNYFDFCFDLTEQEEKCYQEEKDAFLQGKKQAVFMEVVQRFQHIYTIAKNKVDGLFKLIEEILARGEKVVIYTKYFDEIRFFEESGLLKRGKYVVLSGRTNKKRAIKFFGQRINVMFATYGVDGRGLNLCNCNNIIYFSQTFDYKCKLQCMRNVYQSYNGNDVNIYNLWINTGLDKLIRQNLNRKRNVLSNVCRMISKEEAMSL